MYDSKLLIPIVEKLQKIFYITVFCTEDCKNLYKNFRNLKIISVKTLSESFKLKIKNYSKNLEENEKVFSIPAIQSFCNHFLQYKILKKSGFYKNN